MSDFIDSLWSQFEIEFEEHVEQIEEILIEAETEALNKEGIDTLFRSFHTIKGLSIAMDLTGMGTIAHKTEDILGLLRDGTCPIALAEIPLFLSSVDALKHHMSHVRTNKQDLEPDEQLISQLVANYNQSNSGNQLNEAPIETNTSNPEPTHDPEKYKQSTLHEDPDMLLFFSELLAANIPNLTLLIELEQYQEITEEVLETLDTLSLAADSMGFEILQEQLNTLLDLAKDPNSSDDPKESLNAGVRDVLSFITVIEEDTGLNCGTASIQSAFQKTVCKKCHELLLDYYVVIANIRKEIEGEEFTISSDRIDKIKVSLFNAPFTTIFQELSSVGSDEQLKYMVHTFEELLTVACQKPWRGKLDLIPLLESSLNDLLAMFEQFKQQEEITLTYADCEARATQLWNIVNTLELEDIEQPTLTYEELTGIIDLNPKFEESITNEHLQELNEWISKEKPIYEVTLFLEKSEAFTEKFLEWSAQHIEILTNFNHEHEGELACEALVLSELKEAEFRDQVKALDPNREHFIVRACSKQEEAKPAPQQAATDDKKDQSILRVPGKTLDQFMRQIGEMVSIRGMLKHCIHEESTTTSLNGLRQKLAQLSVHPGLCDEIEAMQLQLDTLDQQIKRMDQIDRKLYGVLSQLQESALALRVVSVETVFKRFSRIVRDLSVSQSKIIRLEMDGLDVKIDKATAEILQDPLMHMVRNSVDHGMELPEDRINRGKPERGTIKLSAKQKGSSVLVVIEDDGRGINVEAVKTKALEKGLVSNEQVNSMEEKDILKLIFQPGFSTAATITETSGRGVGMDVVLSNVSRIGGNIDIESKLGGGTKFSIEVPLSTAIQDTLLVRVEGQTLAIPERFVSEMIEVDRAHLQSIKGCQAIDLRNSFLPVYPLGPLLGFEKGRYENDTYAVAVLSDGKQRIGIIVDRSYQRQELFIKEINQKLTELPGVASAAILGDGRVVLILDVEDIFDLAVRHGGSPLVQGVFNSVA